MYAFHRQISPARHGFVPQLKQLFLAELSGTLLLRRTHTCWETHAAYDPLWLEISRLCDRAAITGLRFVRLLVPFRLKLEWMMPRSLRNLSCLDGMRKSQWEWILKGTHKRRFIVSILPHSIYPVSSFKSVRRPFRYEARLGSVDDSTRLTSGGTSVAGCLRGTPRRVIPFKSTNTEIQNSFHLIVREIGRYCRWKAQTCVEKDNVGHTPGPWIIWVCVFSKYRSGLGWSVSDGRPPRASRCQDGGCPDAMQKVLEAPHHSPATCYWNQTIHTILWSNFLELTVGG